MSESRERFLQRVREAVTEGNRAGGAPGLPQRGTTGYQGAGQDVFARLDAELAAAGGQLHIARDAREASSAILELVENRSARRVLVGDGEVLDSLDLVSLLSAREVTVWRCADLPANRQREEFFAADVGISGVEHVIAETGTLVLATRPGQPRSVSLLPPVHIAVARREQIIPDLFDLFASPLTTGPLPSCLSLITGPSKTGDIELRLVTGVHGPGEVHLVVF